MDKFFHKDIKKLIEKSNFEADSNLINFMETSFSEVKKMVFTFLQYEFVTDKDEDFFLNNVSFTLKEIVEINKIREKYSLEDEEIEIVKKNCFFKDNRIVYKKP